MSSSNFYKRNLKLFSEFVKNNSSSVMSPRTKNLIVLKNIVRSIGAKLYNFRYLNTLNFASDKPVYAYSLFKYKHGNSPMFFRESKVHELFESSDKAKYLAATLISIDSSELGTVDSYKDNYPFTVTKSLIIGCIC